MKYPHSLKIDSLTQYLVCKQKAQLLHNRAYFYAFFLFEFIKSGLEKCIFYWKQLDLVFNTTTIYSLMLSLKRQAYSVKNLQSS